MMHAIGSLKVSMRKARLRDAALVARVTRQSFAQYRRGRRGPIGAFLLGSQVRRQLRSGKKCYGLAFMGVRAVGVIGYKVKRRRLIFGPLGVVPGYRRNGVGSALMRWCEAQARRHRCREMRAEVLRGLRDLIEFYQNKGFRTFRSRKGLTYAVKHLHG